MEMLAYLAKVHAKRDQLQKFEILEKASCLWMKILIYASHVMVTNITTTLQMFVESEMDRDLEGAVIDQSDFNAQTARF
jgi:hypothetical protein